MSLNISNEILESQIVSENVSREKCVVVKNMTSDKWRGVQNQISFLH
jgi:hypothetical protein